MKNSIQSYVMRRLLVTFIPIILITLYLLAVLKWQNDSYRDIVKNLSIATNFNFKFKENIDHKMYRIVIGADTIENLKPYDDLNYAKNIFERLLNSANSPEAKKKPNGLIKLADILERHIDNIAGSDIYKDYDSNMRSLEYDIRVTTDLIEHTMNDYIYEETKELDTVRAQLEKQMSGIFIFSAASVVMILMFMVYMYRQVSRHIAGPIEALRDYTKRSENDLLLNNFKSSISEIDELSENFNAKILRINDLISNIRQEQERQRQTELQLLQSQINPHFLYNTLDTVVWMAESGNSKKVVDMITALSNFLRIGLNKGNDFIQIRDEIKHIESYLKIQKFRYEDILEYSVDIDENLYDMKILKLMLQPLVENALYHGIKYKRGRGKINVSGYREKSSIVFQVEDNGVGMDADKLKKVRTIVSYGNTPEFIKEQEEYLARLKKQGQTGRSMESFGLYNVAERIRLYYGNKYGLLIESEEGVGTIVTIRLPANT